MNPLRAIAVAVLMLAPSCQPAEPLYVLHLTMDNPEFGGLPTYYKACWTDDRGPRCAIAVPWAMTDRDRTIEIPWERPLSTPVRMTVLACNRLDCSSPALVIVPAGAGRRVER